MLQYTNGYVWLGLKSPVSSPYMGSKGVVMKVVYSGKLLENSKSGPGDDKDNDIEDAWNSLKEFFSLNHSEKKCF